jgi:hypothetical protein
MRTYSSLLNGGEHNKSKKRNHIHVRGEGMYLLHSWSTEESPPNNKHLSTTK